MTETAATPIIETKSRDFNECFNRSPFLFRHTLGSHPLFSLARLAKAAETMLAGSNPDHFVHRAGDGAPGGGLDRAARERVAEAVAHVDRPGSWIKLTKIQDADPEYKELLDQILRELEERSGVPLRSEITWVSATVFIGSPHSVTPYHIDHETNFLFQIGGEKEVNLFDPFDRSVLTEEEIERFYIGELNAVNYVKANQPKAHVYRMKAGDAVHHPTLAPHWVKNGSSPTIALSVGFCMQSLDPRARVYQVNHYLRKLGLRPTPIDQVAWKDAAKIGALGLFSTRYPKTDREAIDSGITRIKAPARVVKGWLKRLREP